MLMDVHNVLQVPVCMRSSEKPSCFAVTQKNHKFKKAKSLPLRYLTRIIRKNLNRNLIIPFNMAAITPKPMKTEKKPSIQRKILLWVPVIISLISIGFTAYFGIRSMELTAESNRLNRETVELQNMLQNWTAVMNVEADHADLLTSISSDDLNVGKTLHHGYLNLSVEIISPHFSNLNISIQDFEVLESYNFVLPETRHLAKVDLIYPENYDVIKTYEKRIVPGYSSLDLNLFLRASLYLDANQFPNPEDVSRYPSGLTQTYDVGELTLKIELLDLQTKEVIVQEISERIVVSVHVY